MIEHIQYDSKAPNLYFCELLGKSIHTFQTIELLMKITLSGLIGGDKKLSEIIISSLPTMDLLKALSCCIEEKYNENDQPRKIKDEIYKLIVTLIEKRNLIVHSNYLYDDTVTKMCRLNARGSKKFRIEHHEEPIDELKSFLSESATVRDKLLELYSSIFPNKPLEYL